MKIFYKSITSIFCSPTNDIRVITVIGMYWGLDRLIEQSWKIQPSSDQHVIREPVGGAHASDVLSFKPTSERFVGLFIDCWLVCCWWLCAKIANCPQSKTTTSYRHVLDLFNCLKPTQTYIHTTPGWLRNIPRPQNPPPPHTHTHTQMDQVRWIPWMVYLEKFTVYTTLITVKLVYYWKENGTSTKLIKLIPMTFHRKQIKSRFAYSI